MKQIVVIGCGYVGISNAVLFAKNAKNVTIVDIDDTKITKINQKISPISDREIETALKQIDLKASKFDEVNWDNTEVVIVAISVNNDAGTNKLDTKPLDIILENIVKVVKPSVPIIIKSTLPIGYTESISRQLNAQNIIFMPEFLREGKALYDNLYPSRIIVGETGSIGAKIAQLYLDSAIKKDVPILQMSSTEAEAVKLFSNTYLALKISYFNELDTYAESHNLDTEAIIRGVSLDERIGNNYNNPSFGYGGYCLPKDSKQLVDNFIDVPNAILTSIVESNEIRKKYIAQQINNRHCNTIGIYRLTMKSCSDNFREAAIIDVISYLENKNILIYEPLLDEPYWQGYEVVNDLAEFKKRSECIIANRKNDDLLDVKEKVYTRDIFQYN